MTTTKTNLDPQAKRPRSHLGNRSAAGLSPRPALQRLVFSSRTKFLFCGCLLGLWRSYLKQIVVGGVLALLSTTAFAAGESFPSTVVISDFSDLTASANPVFKKALESIPALQKLRDSQVTYFRWDPNSAFATKALVESVEISSDSNGMIQNVMVSLTYADPYLFNWAPKIRTQKVPITSLIFNDFDPKTSPRALIWKGIAIPVVLQTELSLTRPTSSPFSHDTKVARVKVDSLSTSPNSISFHEPFLEVPIASVGFYSPAPNSQSTSLSSSPEFRDLFYFEVPDQNTSLTPEQLLNIKSLTPLFEGSPQDVSHFRDNLNAWLTSGDDSKHSFLATQLIAPPPNSHEVAIIFEVLSQLDLRDPSAAEVQIKIEWLLDAVDVANEPPQSVAHWIPYLKNEVTRGQANRLLQRASLTEAHTGMLFQLLGQHPMLQGLIQQLLLEKHKLPIELTSKTLIDLAREEILSANNGPGTKIALELLARYQKRNDAPTWREWVNRLGSRESHEQKSASLVLSRVYSRSPPKALALAVIALLQNPNTTHSASSFLRSCHSLPSDAIEALRALSQQRSPPEGLGTSPSGSPQAAAQDLLRRFLQRQADPVTFFVTWCSGNQSQAGEPTDR